MASRSRAREQALQILFLIDLAETPTAEALEVFRLNFESYEEDFDFVRSLVNGVSDHLDEINDLIDAHSEHWRVNRMPRVDRNVLRIGTYELKYDATVPTAVILDEAVELGKKYGDARTSSFVNGVLDRISRALRK